MNNLLPEIIDNKTATFGAKTNDPFLEFYRQKEEKYADILSIDETHEYVTDITEIWEKIFNYELTTQELEDFLKGFDQDESKTLVLSDIKAAIADSIGEMLETYRYESTQEGQAIERYIDDLLAIVYKHEHDNLKTSLQDVSAPKELKQKRVISRVGTKKPLQDTLFV